LRAWGYYKGRKRECKNVRELGVKRMREYEIPRFGIIG
jgi:hypothetical protein